TKPALPLGSQLRLKALESRISLLVNMIVTSRKRSDLLFGGVGLGYLLFGGDGGVTMVGDEWVAMEGLRRCRAGCVEFMVDEEDWGSFGFWVGNNSGSLQSSSEAEEECDSRATNNNQPHQPAPRFNHHLIFDQNQINDNIINPFFFTSNPQHNQLLNLDSVIWSKTLPSFSDHDHFPTATITTEPIPPPPPRNPKKRSRASRRAPTTVLTTDTSNFRAMVQEFTGIPSPPFTSSSSSSNAFPRLMTSFDLFGRPSTNNNFDNLSQLPSSYLIKPSPSSLLDSSNLLINSMQSLPSSNSINQSLLFLNPKSTQNIGSSNGFGVMGQNQVHEPMPTITKTRN
nr:hypothetical protein [Tanacetum cinerariifolium]